MDKDYEYKIGNFMYKLDNNLLPVNIINMFQKVDNDRRNITSGYLLPTVKTNYGKRFITFKGIHTWKGMERYSKNNKRKRYLKIIF